MAHTPWTLEPYSSGSGNDEDYAVRDASGQIVFLDTFYYPVAPSAEEAATILICVNNHDQLVAALRWVRANYASGSTKEINDRIATALEGL